MASKRQRKRREKRRITPERALVERPLRLTPVQAIELQHRSLADQLAKRPDRFSQLLARQFRDEHAGQELVTRSGLSEREHEELVSLAEEAHASFRDELNAATRRLRDLLGRGDPLHIASWVQTSTLLTGWGGYYEPTQERGENRVELVAGLLCSQPVARDLTGPSNVELQKIHEEVEHILELLLLFNLSMPRGDDVDAAELRFTGVMHWMNLRGSSFANHGEDLARALFAPHADWLLKTYGFTVEDVISVGAAATSLYHRSVNALLNEARACADRAAERLDGAEALTELQEGLARSGSAEEARILVGSATFMDVFQAGVREAATFSVDELCNEMPGVPQERVVAVLDELSIPVGSLDSTAYTGLFDPSPLVECPFLFHDGRYLLPVPGMLVRDTVAVLDSRLIRGNAHYSKSRAKTLDRLAVEYLAAMLSGAAAHTNLFYGDAELDGLVLFDDVAFVVEGKGSSISVQAQRGDVRRLVNDIRDAVQDAWEQGARARDFLLSPGDAVFVDEHGNEKARVRDGTVREVHILNPTIHELAGHGPQLARLRSQGLFAAGELPWSVYINDLRVIAETSDNAAVFLHYLVWRARLPLGDQLIVQDELDLWASYLLCERFGMLAGDGKGMIGNATTDFDAYYDGLQGRGPKRDRPRKFLEEPVKAFVERMAAERSPGWRDAAGVCLDLSIPELGAICFGALDAARVATEQGEPAEFRFGRTSMIALPKGTELAAAREQVGDEVRDATLIVYVRQVSTKRAEVVWAEYGQAVTFELSDFEKSVLNAPATSPFLI